LGIAQTGRDLVTNFGKPSFCYLKIDDPGFRTCIDDHFLASSQDPEWRKVEHTSKATRQILRLFKGANEAIL
jgi:hypothetical protein